MNKHNIFGLFAVFTVLLTLSLPAHSESFGRQKAKELEANASQNCAQEGRNPAYCACQSEKMKSPQFLMFAESVKAEDEIPVLIEYYTQNVVIPCFLDRNVSRQMCFQHMKQKTTEYSDRMLNDYCDCMVEEINENVDRNALKRMDRAQIQAEFTALSDKAHPVCDMVRTD